MVLCPLHLTNIAITFDTILCIDKVCHIIIFFIFFDFCKQRQISA